MRTLDASSTFSRYLSSGRGFLGFNKLVPPELVPPHFTGKECVLILRVLPTVFLNSVSIAQHVRRNVVNWAEMAGVGPENEIKKDKTA